MKKKRKVRQSLSRFLAAESRDKALFNHFIDEGLIEGALALCKDIAAMRKVVATCFYGPWICGYSNEKSDLNVLSVLDEYEPKLRVYFRPINGIGVFTLTADKKIFEKDVEDGWLGEFVAGKITTPYELLVNHYEYLQHQEVKLKRRIIWELLENIVLEYPELSHELLINVEYFLYEAMMRRASLFPPITYSFLNMLREDVRAKNLERMMKGYLKALDKFIEEGWVASSDELVKITQRFMGFVKKRRLQVPNFLRSVQKALPLYAISVFPKMMRPFIQDQEIFLKSHLGTEVEKIFTKLEDPRKHLFITTPLGLVPLSDKTTINEFVRKVVPGKILDIKIEDLGGVFTVFLLTFKNNRREQKVVVKKFKNRSGFKWFPLALWTLGTQSIAVLGRTRQEREYAVTEVLLSQGLHVPRILYVSPQEHLIFKDFVEGENLVVIIKQIISATQTSIQETSLIREVGRAVAKTHKLGVTLGDCKPENMVVKEDGIIYFVDLEQGTRNGNQALDIAQFLYYSGHYISPLSSKAAIYIAREFIKGYLEAGGSKETIKRAGSVRYTKVFGLFTPLHVILTISNICKKMGGD